jgi:hypothetical protein
VTAWLLGCSEDQLKPSVGFADSLDVLILIDLPSPVFKVSIRVVNALLRTRTVREEVLRQRGKAVRLELSE